MIEKVQGLVTELLARDEVQQVIADDAVTDKVGALLKNRSITDQIKSVVKDEEGASLVEYALIVALIAVVCIAAVTAVGTAAKDKLGAASTGLGATP